MFTNFPVQFGEYTLHELIARGGMAEVYRATKAGIGGFEKPVAIKMILPHLAENEEFIKMFTDEAQLIVSINHKNIAQVYDFCYNEGRYFIAMEFVHGIDVATLLRHVKDSGNFIPVEHTTYIALCVCSGLYYAHTRTDKEGKPLNIVHRDISPQNILLSYEGEVTIIDFGIAKAKNRDASTRAGEIKGKLHYMAPEQARGEEIDGRADIFSTGIVFYELLTGKLPFDGESEFEIYNNVTTAEICPPQRLNPAVTPELERIVLKMLERDLDKRYANAHEAERDLEKELKQLSPGYTNTRLRQFIEDVLEPEERKKGGEGSKSKSGSLQSNRTQKNSLPPALLVKENSSVTAVEKKESLTTESGSISSDSSEFNSFSPITHGDGSGRRHVQPSDFEVPESVEQTIPNTGGLRSYPVMITLALVGFAIIAGASIATFYLLSRETSGQVPLVTMANMESIEDQPSATPALDLGFERSDKHAVVTSKAVQQGETSHIVFNSEPQGATVLADGKFIGITPFVMYTDQADVTVTYTFLKDKYKEVSFKQPLGSEINKTVTLKPATSKPTIEKKQPPGQRKRKTGETSTGLINPFGL